MCDCWLIDRAATPIASTGGAASSTGTTSSGSIATVHGQRGCSRGSRLADDLDDREHAPPDRGVEDEAVAGRDARAAREAGAAQELGALVEPVLGQRAAGVADRLEPDSRARAARAIVSG